MTERFDLPGVAPLPRHKAHVRVGVFVSAIYIWSYFLTVAAVDPIQRYIEPSLVMNLLFLPHGVRVLSAWLYGWRSILYLVPGAMACNLHFAGSRAFDPEIICGTLASLVAAPLAFSLMRCVAGADWVTVGSTRLATVIAVGFVASIFNLVALKVIFGLHAREGLVIFVGDTSGLLASMLVLSVLLRFFGRRI